MKAVWDAWSTPADIQRWNAASGDWRTTRSTVDLREGRTFLSRMEAKDGSAGFDFEGTYTRIVSHSLIEYRMSDGREVRNEFVERGGVVAVTVTFDAEPYLRRGVARRLLAHIIDEARRRGYARLSLETGSAAAFEPAQRLYASAGFAYCGPFGGYVEDPYSVFMTRDLRGAP